MQSRIFAVSMLLLVAGCANQQPKLLVECKSPIDVARKGSALVGQEYGIQMSPIPLDALQFTDADVAHSVAVQAVRATRTPADTVQVTARLVNCTDKPMVVRARTSFMDATQLPTEPVSAWRIIPMPARATSVYQENSASVNVAHYLVELAKE